MNRIIKFRVWDIDNKEMVYHPTISIPSHQFDLDSGYGETLLNKEFISNRRIYQQFTGLFDKTGKEIFEGDVLSFPTSNWMNQTVEVVWYEKQHCWALKNKHGIQHTTSGGRAYLIKGSDVEIIGNIYEAGN